MSRKHGRSSVGNATLRSALLAKLVKGKRHADAEILAGKVLAATPEHPQALRVCIDAALSRGRENDALPLCERLIQVSPDNVWAKVNCWSLISSRSCAPGPVYSSRAGITPSFRNISSAGASCRW